MKACNKVILTVEKLAFKQSENSFNKTFAEIP